MRLATTHHIRLECPETVHRFEKIHNRALQLYAFSSRLPRVGASGERQHILDQSRGGSDIAFQKATLLEVRGLAMEPSDPPGPAPFERRLQRDVLKRSVFRRLDVRECLNAIFL
jgi:hypothetical protein